jgi:hypothetical protein
MFWKWGVRNPALVTVVLFGLSLATGVTDAALGFSGMAFFAVIGESGNYLTRRVDARVRRAERARAALKAATPVRGRFPTLEEVEKREAA